MKLLGIVGTNAEKSTNRTLLQYMKRHFAPKAEIEIFEIDQIPLFDKPDTKEAPQKIASLAAKIHASDGVIIATPEYDHAVPAALLNVLEWLTYCENGLDDKPVLVVGASYGCMGTLRAQNHLRQVLDAPEMKVHFMIGQGFLLGQSLAAFDDQGNLTRVDDQKALDEYFANFAAAYELS